MERIGRRALLVDFPDDGPRGFVALAGFLQGLELLRRVRAARVRPLAAQRPLDRHLPVAEGRIREDLRLRRFLESKEGLADAIDVGIREFAVLLAEVLAEWLEPRRGVDE